MLITAIRFFADDCAGLKSKHFKKEMSQQTHHFNSASTVDELEVIHERLKNLIFQQGHLEREYRRKQFIEYSKICDALVEGIEALTEGDRLFTDELEGHLGGIRRAVELDDLKQIRAQVKEEISKVKQMIWEKKQSAEERQEALSQQIQTLNTQLQMAREEGLIDELTKVYNRRAFNDHIQGEIKQSHCAGEAFGLMLFDIDHFKQVNDTHGHLVGDRLLFAVGQQAKELLRADDFIARYGGEEFAIVLRHDSISVAWQILERLRLVIAHREFRYRKENGVEQAVHITVSGGIAWFRKSDTVESLIGCADEALYLAKRRGRNRICTEDELGSESL